MKHSDMVRKLVKDSSKILETLDADKVDLLHMSMGISGEVGELTDAVKKHVMGCGDLDIDNVIEELGDIEFYLEGFRQALGITRELTLADNINKLSIRYENFEYSDEQSRARKDKDNPQATLALQLIVI